MNETITADEIWDAGSLGCGPLLLELRNRMRGMPGKTLLLVALDLGAPQDIPAWCRVTGNPLLATEPEHSRYWIKSKTDWG